MKREALILAVISVFILYSAAGSAADVAYVVKTSGNSMITGILNELDYSYSIITDSQISSANFSNYAILLVQDDVVNKNLLPLKTKNSILLGKNIIKDIWPTVTIGTTTASYSKFEQIGTPFTKGFSAIDFKAYTSGKTAYYLKIKPGYVQRIALTTGSSGIYGIVDYSTSGPRSLFFGFPEINYWTNDTRKLFKNSLEWVRNGADNDGDGFYSGEDCNDNNKDINPNATEIAYDFIDNDCSGGDLADVDSDGFCKQEYLIQNKFIQCGSETGSTGSDCNDLDFGINPNATEIIDSIDQNCRNDAPVLVEDIPDIAISEDDAYKIDLDDYFADYEGENLVFSVYNKSAEISVVFNGSNATISATNDYYGSGFVIFRARNSKLTANTNKVNLTISAVNDAPILENIENKSVIAGMKVILRLNASDVDSVNLTYSVNDSRFVKNGNAFEWQTQLNDAGVYHVLASVSDGEKIAMQEVEIKILQKIVINEFLPRPASGDEWVEIYNPGNLSFDLTGCYLEDAAYNHMQLQGSISGKSFLVKNMSNRLNNDGDSIKLKCASLLDEITYGGGNVAIPGTGESAGRITDGYDNDLNSDWVVFKIPTRGISNSADLSAPAVSLISPLNNSVINANFVYFNYSASDDREGMLNCSFYSDVVKKEWKNLSSQISGNGSQSSFWAGDIDNGNYRWQVKCNDSSNLGVSEIFSFRINAPKAPVISTIRNVSINEGEKALIEVNASDSNPEDILTYHINDSRFIRNGNRFEWQTGYNDAGVYYAEIGVSDGVFNSTQKVKITIIDRNQKPVVYEISNITVREDSGFMGGIVLNASDVDGTISRFEVSYEDRSKVDCTINGSKLGVEPASDFFGESSCKIKAYDNIGDFGETIVYIHVENVNDAPEIIGFSPGFSPLISEDGSQRFSVSWKDIDNRASEVSVKWHVDGIEKSSGESYVYNAESLLGEFEIKVIVSDLNVSAEHVWNIKTSDKPVAESYDGGTTNFSGMNDSELASVNLTLEKSAFGRIEMSNVDLRNAVNFDNYADIQRGIAALDSGYFSSLAGKVAKITLYGLGFSKMPVVYYNPGFTLDRNQITQTCPASMCTNASYINGTLTFYSHFSSFKIGDTLSCSQQFGDICSSKEICSGSWLNAIEDKCCSVKCMPKFDEISACKNSTGNLGIEIKNPDEGDEFKIGEKIPVKVNIENNEDDDLDLEVSVYLYDLTINEVIDDASDGFIIDSGENEESEFEINVPSGADENDDFAVLIKVEGNDVCRQEYQDINIKRKKDDVRITRFDLPDYANCNEYIEARIEVKNFGRNDEDINLEITNDELDVSKKFEFTLSEFDEDDNKITKSFLIQIQDYAKEKSYLVEAKAEYSGLSEIVKKEVYVKCDKMLEIKTADSGAIRLNSAAANVQSGRKGFLENLNNLSSNELVLVIVDIFLALGIILIIVYLIAGRR